MVQGDSSVATRGAPGAGNVAAPPLRIALIEALSAGLCGALPTDSGLLQEGLAMRDAVAADLALLPTCTVGIAVEPWLPRASTGACAETFVSRHDDSISTFVRRVAQACDAVWVVAPETDGLLAAACAATPISRWIGCRAEAIDLAASKSATLHRLLTAGLPTPLAFVTTARQWLVKPDDGAGAHATRRHDRHDAALADRRARSRRGESAVLEPWVDGDALSVSLLCRAAGEVELLSVNRQHVHVDADGRLEAHGVTIDVLRATDPRRAALVLLARAAVAAIPGLRGFVGIDLVWHVARGPVVIEVNPRTTSAYVGLSAAIGRNIAADIVADHFEATDQRAR